MKSTPLDKPYPPIITRLARLAVTAHVAFYRLSGGSSGREAIEVVKSLVSHAKKTQGKG